MIASISGVYYDGKSSVAHAGELQLMADGNVSLCLLSEGAKTDINTGAHIGTHVATHINYGFDELRISSRIGNTRRYVHFCDGGKFETSEHDQIDRWQKLFDHNRCLGVAHYLESHKRFVLLGIVVVLATLWLTFKVVIPAVSKEIALQLPQSVSRQLGDSSLALLDQYAFAPSTLAAEQQQHLQALFQRYFFAQIEQFGLSLNFRASDTMGANAFALPSGDLVFTDDIINISGDERELLAVMAHEVGHVSQRHAMRRLIQDSFMLFVFTMITGDVSNVTSAVVAAPTLILEMAYSRQFEMEADEYALAFMRRHNIEPVHFANMMQRLQWQEQLKQQHMGGASDAKVSETNRGNAGEDDVGDIEEKDRQTMVAQLQYYLSSHPAWDQRIQAFGTPTITRQAGLKE